MTAAYVASPREVVSSRSEPSGVATKATLYTKRSATAHSTHRIWSRSTGPETRAYRYT
jgi:hypothetical protein